MITVALFRKTLVRLGACSEGMAFFDRIATLQGNPKRIRVVRWGPLHAVWLRTVAGSFAVWLEERDLLRGTWRKTHDHGTPRKGEHHVDR